MDITGPDRNQILILVPPSRHKKGAEFPQPQTNN